MSADDELVDIEIDYPPHFGEVLEPLALRINGVDVPLPADFVIHTGLPGEAKIEMTFFLRSARFLHGELAS